jgi:hypothetical protein
VLAHTIVHRTHRFAFAHDLGGNALSNFALGTAILDQRLVRPREHVDETGRDRQAGCVDGRLCRRIAEITQSDDAITANGNIRAFRFTAGAIVNCAAFNDEVEVRLLRHQSR